MTEDLHVAGDVDSWCTKCRMWLAHTIVAMVRGVPKRVLCNTCHGEHTYRPNVPGESKAKTRGTGVRQGRAAKKPKARKVSEWETRVGGLDRRKALSYRPAETFEAEQLMDHPSFGLGLVVAILTGSKIKVLFESGDKILVHGR